MGKDAQINVSVARTGIQSSMDKKQDKQDKKDKKGH